MKKLVLLLIGALLLSGCATKTQSNSEYSSDDIAFAEMMIPHHEQAIEMSEIALLNTTDPDVLALATGIRDAQGHEIIQMQGWLDGKSESHKHDMEMGGMLTDAELAQSAALPVSLAM
jgi:uncharacterized protein (DUF305 family)